jgi:hypothetical protein
LLEETDVARISNPELKAAVSAIMERDQSKTPLSEKSQRADLSALSRTHHDQLQSEFAKAGFDFGRLKKLYADYRKEANRLIENQIPSVDSKPVRPSKSDQQWTQNKKRVYELIGNRPLVTFPIVIDKPVAIYSIPSGALVDSHIESWNSWATWNHREYPWGNDDVRLAFLKFLFAWQNNSPNPVVIKNASADISTRGFCQAQANPPAVLSFSHRTTLFLNPYHRVHVGGTTISGDDRWVLYLTAYAMSFVLGGEVDLQHKTIDQVNHVRCQDIVVPSHQIAIFEIGVYGYYSIRSLGPGGGDGHILYWFAGSGCRIACPSVTLELSLVAQS